MAFLVAILAAALAIGSAENGFPIFKTQDETVTVKEGSYVEILCNATSDSPVTYGWYTRFGEQIQGFIIRGSVYRRKSQNGAVLVFDRIQSQEADKYVCWAKNDKGSVKKNFHVKIDKTLGPPVFDQNIQFYEVTELSSVELFCNASGFPTPSYKWYDKNSIEIPNWTEPNAIIFTREYGNGVSLVIESAFMEHDGMYTCAARNIYGMRTKVFEVSVIKKVERPYFEKTNETIEIKEGDRTEVVCAAVGSPSPTYKWFYRNGSEIDNRSPGLSVSNYANMSVLTFLDPTSNHSGTYNCTANNTNGEVSKLFNIYVLAEGPPVFDRLNESANYLEGTYSSIICSARGIPNPFYMWFDPWGYELPSSSMHRSIQNYRNMSVLSFHPALANHTGMYTCTANNTHGEISKAYDIRVFSNDIVGPPFFYILNETVIIQEGYREILCSALGKPMSSYTWRDEYGYVIGGRDNFSSLYTIHYSNGTALVFNVAHPGQSGVYMCHASNIYGERTKQYNIIVESNQRNETDESCIIYRVEVIGINETSVSFSIDTATQYSSMYVRYKENISSEYLYTRWQRFDSFVALNLTPSGVYTFEFQPDAYVTKCYGWQKLTVVTLLPLQPEIVIRGLTGDVLTFEWRRKFTDFRRQSIYKYSLTYYTLSQRADQWEPSSCAVTIDIPTCFANTYKLAGIRRKMYYQFEVRAHTSSGASKPYKQKMYISDE